MEKARLPGGEGRLLLGYGPLVGFLAAMALMVALAPTVSRERIVSAAASLTEDQTLSDQGTQTTQTELVGDPAGTPVTAASQAGVSRCEGQEAQVPGDPYSPPCIDFSGSNGGATSRGVTEDEIRISLRGGGGDLLAVQAEAAEFGVDISEDPETGRLTLEALFDYFNERFQFYGRKMTLVEWTGQGNSGNELLGGGRDAANTDAVRAASDLEVFADFSAYSEPYSDALTKQRVLAWNSLYMSRQWYEDRRPYAWSFTPDCSFLVEFGAEFVNKMLAGRAARWAGGDLQGRTRTLAALAPDNPWYQECVDEARAELAREGNGFDVEVAYTLDIATLSNQAASAVARMKSQHITTVVCGCDPIFPFFLTSKAQEQSYFPEWVGLGTALIDTDFAGQFYPPDQWRRGFGISFLGPIPARQDTLGYQAFKTVRPDDEPSLGVDLVYLGLYFLAVGIHMAGPNLTPEAFERGMFEYPGGFGYAGLAEFGPRKYTPWSDAQIIWWDPDAISIFNNQRGAYRSNGERYRQGEIPRGEPPVFTE